MNDSQVQAVFDALAGHRVLFVGGCVRNAVLGRAASDLDLATDAVPEAVIAAVEAAGLKAVPTGIEHGTVTVVSGGRGFEVTTFRRDVETDGRRAVVQFSTRMDEDAQRRDFTMNALYADRCGQVLDPIGGLEDLQAGRVRFIGDALARIAEDYLRILRFFRFHAWYADPAEGIDAEGLAACAAGVDGLDRLPAERIWQELRKLLAAPDPAPAVAAMAQSGVLARVMPGAVPDGLTVLVALETEAGLAPDPLRRMVALGGPDPAQRLRLSRADARTGAQLRAGVSDGASAATLAWRFGAAVAWDIGVLRAALIGGGLPFGWAEAVARGAAAQFPISASDLMPAFTGPALGARLKQLQQHWIASDLTLDRDGLLALD
nr:CCA tRNA nucleotidyltransferase [Pseudoruegeria sp. SK021]